jgi:hypothetical protein
MVGQVHKLFVTILTALLFQPLERSADSSELWLTVIYSNASRLSALVSLLAVITSSSDLQYVNVCSYIVWKAYAGLINVNIYFLSLSLSMQIFIPWFGF